MTAPMAFRAEIPYGAYWSTPFARWQGSLAHLHSVEFAAHVAKAELADNGPVRGTMVIRPYVDRPKTPTGNEHWQALCA